MTPLVRTSVHHPIAVLMCFAGIAIFGLLSAFDLRTELLPDITLPKLVISSGCPGLPPGEMRELVTMPIEEGLSSIKGLKNMQSVSRQGFVVIELEFQWGTNMMMAAVDTREAIDILYPSLPEQAAKPVVLPVNPGEEPVLWIGAFPAQGSAGGPYPLVGVRRMCEREIKTRLQQVEGVGSISVLGGGIEEIEVAVDLESAAQRGVGIEEISSAVSGSTAEIPAGSFVEGHTEYLVKSTGKVRSLAALGDLQTLGGTKGQTVRLREFASISLVQRERTSVFQYDGNEGVVLLVRRKGGESPVAVSQHVRSTLLDLERAYGRSVNLNIVFDSSLAVTSSMNDLVGSGSLGGGIAFLVLLLFIRRIKPSLILMLSMPVSILITLTLLKACGVSLNTMSLGGLALGIGMLVDNSVIVLENLERRFAGTGRIDPNQVIQGTIEMAGSTFGSTLTSLVVFMPVLFLPGSIGALFGNLALSVCFALLSSFFVAVTLVPVLYMLARNRRHFTGKTQGRSENIDRSMERKYRGIFRFVLRNPVIVSALLAGLTVAGVLAFTGVPRELMATMDTGEIRVKAAFPPGTSMEHLSEAGKALRERSITIPAVDHVFMRAGGMSEDPALLADPGTRAEELSMTIVLKPGTSVSSRSVLETLSGILAVRDATISLSLPGHLIDPIVGASGNGYSFAMTGDTPAEALGRGGQVLAEINDSRLFGPASLSPKKDQAELRVVPDRESLNRRGVTLSSAATAMHAAIEGLYPTRITLDGREIDVRVRADRKRMKTLRDIQSIPVRIEQGGTVRVGELGTIEPMVDFSGLIRVNRRDASLIEAEVLPEGKEKSDRLVSELESRHPYMVSRGNSAFWEQVPRILTMFGLAVVLLYLVLGAQFQSFLLPLLLMSAIPLAFSGISFALFLGGKSLNLSSALGVIVLLGIVVNNSIILYATFADKVKGGASPLAAVYRGSSQRLRPILITVLTTVTGLLPTAIDPMSRSLQSPMALTVVGGLVMSTALTLCMIPLVFLGYLRKFKK